MSDDIIKKIERAGLTGRGGAGYPTAQKWREVKASESDKKYVICNASEGEIGLFKDIFILENHPEKVVKGMKIALDYLGSKKSFFNINRNYYEKVGDRITEIVKEYNNQGYRFQPFIEEPSYIGGEETALLNAIEGKRTEPRQKPPYPSVSGLFSRPTLINNVETFYNVSLVDEDCYEGKRFYSISGPINRGGVHHLPSDWSIEKILKETGNFPEFDFFVQIGGSASGVIYNREQIVSQTVSGAGGIEIYGTDAKPRDVLLRWFNFYQQESCGKCTPCREGSYALREIIERNEDVPWNDIFKILESTKETSFCGLGKSISEPIYSYYSNILNQK